MPPTGRIEGPQLMHKSLGRRLRDLLLILAVSDGEQSVFDECDYRIGRIGLG